MNMASVQTVIQDGKFTANILDFRIAAVWQTVMVQDSMPEFFEAEHTGAPSEIDQRIGSVGNSLPSPSLQFAGFG